MLWGILYKRLPIPLPHRGYLIRDISIKKMIRGHEPETYKFFDRKLNKEDIVADVGAHNGLYATYFSDKVSEVHAYEPDTIAFKKLTKACHGLKNVICFNHAIGKSDFKTNLYGDSGSGTNSIMFGSGGVPVEVKPLPDKYTWAKIDVEGAELQVLEGMKNRIDCVVEFSPTNLTSVGIDPAFFINRIVELGYEWFAIDEKGVECKISVEDLIKKTMGHTNIYLKPL